MRYHATMIKILFILTGLLLAACSNGQDTGQNQRSGAAAPANSGFNTGKRESYDAVGVAEGKDSVSPFGKPANNAYSSNALKDAIRQQEAKTQSNP